MSLIEEALRRVQESISTPKPRPPPLHSEKAELERPRSPLRFNPWVGFALVWGGLSLLVLGLVAGVLWTFRVTVTTKPVTVPVPTTQPSQPASQDSVVGSRPTSPPASFTPVDLSEVAVLPRESVSRKPLPPELELNGIVEGLGESLVIINGNLVRLGETVEGATLLEVQKDSARLRWRDQELVLRTTR